MSLTTGTWTCDCLIIYTWMPFVTVERISRVLKDVGRYVQHHRLPNYSSTTFKVEGKKEIRQRENFIYLDPCTKQHVTHKKNSCTHSDHSWVVFFGLHLHQKFAYCFCL